MATRSYECGTALNHSKCSWKNCGCHCHRKARPQWEIDDYRSAMNKYWIGEGVRRGIPSEVLAELIEYDMEMYLANEVLPRGELDGVLNFLQWRAGR